MDRQKVKWARRLRRQRHVRRNLFGTAEKPRLSIHRSLKNIYCQLIDDGRACTLVAASTRSPEITGQVPNGGNKAGASAVGKLIAEKALAAGIKKVIFDRGPYRYHGRVKALAETAREAGLEF